MGQRERGGLDRSAMHLLHRAGQFANDAFVVEARQFRLTPRQFTVLAALGRTEGLAQTALVERTGIDRSTLADIVARLLSRGLISRRRAEQDARAYEIRLTQAGRTLLAQVEPCAVNADTRLLSRLPLSKRQDFLNSLSLIVTGAED